MPPRRAVTEEYYFAIEGRFWRVNRELVALLAGGRALLLQVAHPKIAAGVAQHSRFTQSPLARLQRTMTAMWCIVFGDKGAARKSLDRIRTVHTRINGFVESGEPGFAGARYSAFDDELLLWVHATLVDSGMAAYQCFVGPLSSSDADQYYEESKILARLFEIPEPLIPGTLGEFKTYMESMIDGNQISVGPTAGRLAKEILYPSPWLVRPGGPLLRLLTAGLLPAPLRQAYGLEWSGGRAKNFSRAVKVIRALRPWIPRPLRIVPLARAAERRARLR